MQLNSTVISAREMDQRPPPPSPAAAADIHRYATPAAPSSARQRLDAPDLIHLTSPPLPMRLSRARLLENHSNGSPGLFGERLRDRPGLRSNPIRSSPNEYVDEPVFSIPDRSDDKPASSSSSSTSSVRTSNLLASESKPPLSSKDKTELTVSSGEPCRESIFCPRCQHCRCVKCRQSRRLPAFRCGQTRQCLPEEVVDCCSCLWCVKAAYKRFSDSSDDELDAASSSEVMCACSGRSCCQRWTVLAALTPCLPCLCLYWPLRWLIASCSACYNCRRQGCHCADARRAYSHGQEALLIAEEPLSSNSSSSA